MFNKLQDKKIKETFDRLPSLDELSALEADGLRADIILVDAQRDKKLHMLKQLITALVKGLNSNPAAIIKKIAGLVRTLSNIVLSHPKPLFALVFNVFVIFFILDCV